MAGFDFIFASNASSFLALNAKYSSSQVNGGHSNINLGYSTSASLLQLQSQFLFLTNGLRNFKTVETLSHYVTVFFSLGCVGPSKVSTILGIYLFNFHCKAVFS